jgi:hypothetical protein
MSTQNAVPNQQLNAKTTSSRFLDKQNSPAEGSQEQVRPSDPFEAAVWRVCDTVPHEELPLLNSQDGKRKYKTTKTQQISAGIVVMDGVKYRRQATFNVNYFPMGGNDSNRELDRALKTIARVSKNLSPADREKAASAWLESIGDTDESSS